MRSSLALLLVTASLAIVEAAPFEKRQNENLQPFTGAIGGKTAPPVINDNSNRPFRVGNDGFLTLADAIQRSCDIQVNQCQDFFNSLPNENKQGIQQGDCNAQGENCRAGNNEGNEAAADPSAVVDGPLPQNAPADGADVNADPVASNQDKADDEANKAVDQGAPPPVAVGGKGGIDPATGETLFPLPNVSQFCQDSGQTPADGTQIPSGFCSSLPQGQIPSTQKMVSTIILEPSNGGTVDRNKDFDCVIQVSNLQTGFFTVAASEYYTQPQTLNDQGIIKGHSHVTIQQLTSLQQAPDANVKAFFKGLNDKAADGGKLSVTVPAGTLTTPGTYRICTMSGGFSHQPVVMPIAQRGAQDDCIRVTVV